jgi:hypothetical protein
MKKSISLFLFFSILTTFAYGQKVSLNYIKELPPDALDENLGVIINMEMEK